MGWPLYPHMKRHVASLVRDVSVNPDPNEAGQSNAGPANAGSPEVSGRPDSKEPIPSLQSNKGEQLPAGPTVVESRTSNSTGRADNSDVSRGRAAQTTGALRCGGGGQRGGTGYGKGMWEVLVRGGAASTKVQATGFSRFVAGSHDSDFRLSPTWKFSLFDITSISARRASALPLRKNLGFSVEAFSTPYPLEAAFEGRVQSR